MFFTYHGRGVCPMSFMQGSICNVLAHAGLQDVYVYVDLSNPLSRNILNVFLWHSSLAVLRVKARYNNFLLFFPSNLSF
jgi:hypothetical protein